MFDKSLPAFEPWISGVGGDRSTNWPTTTAPQQLPILLHCYNAINKSSITTLLSNKGLWLDFETNQLCLLQIIGLSYENFLYKLFSVEANINIFNFTGLKAANLESH